MANFYTEIPELKYHLNNPMMKRICELKERNYRDKDEFDYAPLDFEDALDSYDKVLEITGEITGEIINANAEGVDEEGPHCANGRVEYASGTKENLDAMVKAGLNGMTMPRRFGGLNFPITPYTMCAEIVAAADAGFGNIWSLQDCIETLYEFGNADQHSRFIPRVCQGETMSMDLTEPDAGSDLQAVMLKATYSEKDGCWLLNGVKRFITNGDADIHLVLARSEEGTRDGRGLSMFIYDKRQGGVDVRRIEHKLGIHGSPTCELVYKNAKAELCGDRKLGLIKYVMALMNGARLGIAAQSVGLSQAAYNEGLAYAKDRKQFGKAIIDFPAVYDMLAIMKGKLDAGRALLYQTARYVDIYKALDDISRERKLTPEERLEQKKYAQFHSACQRYELRICESERLRLYTDSRRLGLHDGICLPAHLPRRTYHQHLRRYHPVADCSRYPLCNQRFLPCYDPRIRNSTLFTGNGTADVTSEEDGRPVRSQHQRR